MDFLGKVIPPKKQSEEFDRQNSQINILPPAESQNAQANNPPGSVNNDGVSQYEQQTYKGVNQILTYKFKNNPPIYYVPCYLRMGVVRVRQIDYIESKAVIETEVRIWVMLNDFPEDVQNQIMNQTKITINAANKDALINIQQPPKLDQSHIRNQTKKSKGFIIYQEMELDIESDPFWSPFQLIKLVANIQIKKIVIGDTKESLINNLPEDEQKLYKNAQIEFNFLDAHPFLQFSFGQVRNLGSFDIAESLVDMKWSNDSIKQDDLDEDEDDNQQINSKNQDNQQMPLQLIGNLMGLPQKIRTQKLKSGDVTPDAYEHGQIVIPLYKYPSTTIINVFVPFYIVAIMTLGVFFQANDMSNRDASIATFQLAFIAFFPTIRQNLPQTPKLVFSEIMVYIQSVCTLMIFFYSLYVNGTQGYVFDWQTNEIFLACMILTILNISTVTGLFLIHKLVWERRYNKLPPNSHKYIGAKNMNTDDCQEWWNPACEQQFKEPIQLGLVKPFKPFKLKKKKKVNKKKGKNPLAMFMPGSDSIIQPANSTKIHPLAE